MLTFKLIEKMLDKKYVNIWQMFYTHILAVIFFAIIYYLVTIYLLKRNIKTEFNSFYQCFYLSLITQSTLGYDKVIKEHRYIKNIQILQMISIFILIPFI